MNETQIRARLQEINTRLQALNGEIDAVDLASAEAETRLASLNDEVARLVNERASLNNQLAQAVRNGFDNGSRVTSTNPAPAERADLVGMNAHDQMAYILGKRLRGKTFDDAEKRALGVALTTTATEYVAATASVNGVNNAGVFISTKVLLDLLKEEGKLSPIFKDINFSHIKGYTEFPYRESRTAAKAKKEGVAGTDNQMKFNKLTLVQGYLQTIIPVTDNVLALSDFDLGAYIIDQMLQDLEEDWSSDLIYGTGTDDHIKGITVGATAAVAGGYDASAANFDIAKVLTDAIKKCKGKFRKGAKLYVSQDVYDSVFFALDNNGNFRYPVFNNSVGISSLGTVRVELDENLNEGDFIIGNVSKYYRANCLIPLRMEQDRHAGSAVTDFVASEFCAAAPFPGAFIYGSKKVA